MKTLRIALALTSVAVLSACSNEQFNATTRVLAAGISAYHDRPAAHGKAVVPVREEVRP